MSPDKPQPLQKTMASTMEKRLKTCDTMRGEAITDLKTLRGEAISKHDQTSRAVKTLSAQAQKNPDNPKVQRELAGALNARKMFHHAAELNDSLLESEGESVSGK